MICHLDMMGSLGFEACSCFITRMRGKFIMQRYLTVSTNMWKSPHIWEHYYGMKYAFMKKSGMGKEGIWEKLATILF
jgi:hypothetical protein